MCWDFVKVMFNVYTIIIIMPIHCKENLIILMGQEKTMKVNIKIMYCFAPISSVPSKEKK